MGRPSTDAAVPRCLTALASYDTIPRLLSQTREAKMDSFQPGWLPFAVGSMPHDDPATAWDLILHSFPSIPSWPQLPGRTHLENMYVQFSEGFPGITLD